MTEELKTIFETLNAGNFGEKTYLDQLNEFLIYSGNTQLISEDNEGVACVYYQLLSCAKDVYSARLSIDCTDFPKQTQDILLKSFDNIMNISFNNSDSFSEVLCFLKDIKRYEHWDYDEYRKTISSTAHILLDVLERIDYVFYFKDENNNLIFPINKLISQFIRDSDFLNASEGITPETISILKLAVKLFETDTDGKLILDRIVKDCNLKFIVYLVDNCSIIDTKDFLNYKTNGTLIFYNQNTSRVLIHNENKDYFHGDHYGEISCEFDYKKKEIGYYVEIEYENEKSVSCFKLLENEQYRLKVLSLLFEQGIYNIFLSNSLLLLDNGETVPLNPFCKNDEVVIIGDNEHNGEKYSKDYILDILKLYRICSVKAKGLNRLSLGLIVQLCVIKKVPISVLLSSLNSDCWYQNQVLLNWVNSPQTTIDDFEKMVDMWYEQVKLYNSIKSIGTFDIRNQDFYPLQFNRFSELYSFIVSYNTEDLVLLYGTVLMDEDEETITSIAIEQKGVFPIKECIDSFCQEEQSLLSNKAKVIVLFSESNKKVFLCNQRLLGKMEELEQLQKYLVPISVGKCFRIDDLNMIFTSMRLFSDAFAEIANQRNLCSVNDFESQAYLRIIHNLMWSRIDSDDKAKKYISIIRNHQCIFFSTIKEEWETLLTPGVLLLPKDNESKDSVLFSIYFKYIKRHSERECNPFYNIKINEKDGHYYIGDCIVSSIIMITDNYLCGGATIRSIRAYLGLSIDSSDPSFNSYIKACESIQPIFCNGKPVPVSDILKKNKECSFSVVGLYGTDEGRKKIDKFLDDKEIKHDPTKFFRIIADNNREINSMAEEIWGEKKGFERFDGLFYPVIREFNLPKKTVFPEEMIRYPNKAICLFVQKKELESIN